jgi:hypothetical protein
MERLTSRITARWAAVVPLVAVAVALFWAWD